MMELEEQIRRIADHAERVEPDLSVPCRGGWSLAARAGAVAVLVLAGALSVGWALTSRDDPQISSLPAVEGSVQLPTAEPSAEPSYDVVNAVLLVSDGRVTINAGASDGVIRGAGVYRDGLIGVIDDVDDAKSTIRMFDSSDLRVPAAVTYEDLDAVDRSGFSTITGHVTASVDGVVFVPDAAGRDPDALVSQDVVVAGGPGSRLQAKTPIGRIERSTTVDGQIVWLLEAQEPVGEGRVTIVIRDDE